MIDPTCPWHICNIVQGKNRFHQHFQYHWNGQHKNGFSNTFRSKFKLLAGKGYNEVLI